MKAIRLLLLLVIVVLLVTLVTACGSSSGNATTSASQSQQGKITAKASGIKGQNGKIFAAAAYNYDWTPGATGPAVAGLVGPITSDNFSFTDILNQLNAWGDPSTSTADMIFDPGTYSVVFYVSAPGGAPQYFAKLRVTVKGDVTATAPNWSSWTRLPAGS